MFLSSWLRSQFIRKGSTRPTSKHRWLSLESLDDRSLPSFTPGTLPVDGTVVASTVGDFNKDGFDDVAVIYNPGDPLSGDRLSVFLGKANGPFTDRGPIGGYLLGSHISLPKMGAGDVNGDGKIDIVYLYSGESVRVQLGNGDGTLSTRVYSTSVGTAYSLAVADLNRDGKADVVVGRDGGVAVLLARKGGGSTLFDAARAYQTTTWATDAVTVGDVNGDGKNDIVALADAGGNDLNHPSQVSVLLGDGKGAFATSIPTWLPAKYCSDLVLGDFTRDGKQDLAVVNGADLFVLPGNGNGTFGPAATYHLAFDYGFFPDTVTAADFNGDGKLDLAVSSSEGFGVGVLLGNGDGTFAAPQVYVGEFAPIRVGDFNGDGSPDLVVGGSILFNANDWGV